MVRLLQAVVKIAVAALIVGTILAHFGITLEALGNEFGISTDRFRELLRQGVAWTLPNLVLGLVVIIPLWFLVYILRPPRQSRE
jgi:putative exporter of polyketide antibiotics